MSTLRAEDFRFAVRRLRKSVGTTLASVLALAFGIGAAAAAWSLLTAVLLEPLPVRDPDRLFVVEPQLPALPGGMQMAPTLSYPNFEAITDSGAFESVAASGNVSTLVTEQGGIPRRRRIYFANHEFFSTLGVSVAHGRAFAADEDVRGAAPVAVLSHAYWRNTLNADPDVIGRSVQVADTPVTIVGVLPRGFRGLSLAESPDLYLPLHTVDDFRLVSGFNYLGPGFVWLSVVGRLRDEETPAVAAARVDASLPQGEHVLRDVNTAAVPEAARSRMSRFTTLLSMTVGLLVLIGSLTVGMLLLLRTEERRNELSVCLALGATRPRLASGIAAEATILAGLSAVLAIPVTWMLLSGVRAFQLPGRVDIELLELTLDADGWLAIAGAALVTTCAVTVLASLIGLTGHTSAPLQSRTVIAPRTTRRGLRTALVAGQVAITLVLVAGAGLFTRSLTAALNLNGDVDTDRIMTADVWLQPYGYTPERAARFFDELRDRLRVNGTIDSVSIAQDAGGLGPGGRITIDRAPREMTSFLWFREVDEAYFSTLDLPILDGRSFTRTDTSGSPLVVVVSESFGRLIAGDESPLGHTVSVRTDEGEPAVAEVVGVVPDLITNVNATEPLVMYYALAQRDRSLNAALAIRTAADARAAMREVTAAVRDMDPRVTPAQMSTLDEQIGRQMNAQRFGMYVLGALGGIALLLTVLGAYVVAESMVVRRRREMSIRAALGAGVAHLRGLVLRDTARLVGIGIIGGLVLAALGARLIRSLLYQVQPLDPTVLATASVLILGLVMIVSLRPALEATRLDLTRSLREE